MFYGPGAGSGPTASAVVADILNIAGIRQLGEAQGELDPLLAANSWRSCHLVENSEMVHSNYLRLKAIDTPGVIGKIGSLLGDRGVSIQSIVQFDASESGAEIVVITHRVKQGQMMDSITAIKALKEVKGIAAQMCCL